MGEGTPGLSWLTVPDRGSAPYGQDEGPEQPLDTPAPAQRLAPCQPHAYHGVSVVLRTGPAHARRRALPPVSSARSHTGHQAPQRLQVPKQATDPGKSSRY
jgi:hypothetical protein